MLATRVREHNGIPIPETNARFCELTTQYAGRYVDRYLASTYEPDRVEFLHVFNGLKAAAAACSRHEYGSESSLSDASYIDGVGTRVAKPKTPSAPGSVERSLAAKQADRAFASEMAALQASAAAAARKTQKSRENASRHANLCNGGSQQAAQNGGQQQGGVKVVSLYERDFEDWSARGMASKVHRNRELDWGADVTAPFAAKLDIPEEAAAFAADIYQSVYGETIAKGPGVAGASSSSSSSSSAHARATLPPAEIVQLYAGDILRASQLEAATLWYDAASPAEQESFKDVMRRFAAFLKRTTTAAGHDWRTVAAGKQSKMQVSRHAYSSSQSLVNASVTRADPKLKPDRDALLKQRNHVELEDEAAAAAIRSVAEARASGGAVIDARRGTSLATEGYGVSAASGRNAHLLSTTYGLAFNGEDARRQQPPLPQSSYHHKPSSIPDMALGQKGDHDALTTTYTKNFRNKHERAREYRAQAVTQTDQWNARTFV